MIKGIAFKAKDKKGRYLSDGIDCGDWDDDRFDTKVLSNSMIIIRHDLKEPEEKDIEDFYKSFGSLPITNDVESLKENYDPVPVILTQSELKIIRDRNDW